MRRPLPATTLVLVLCAALAGCAGDSTGTMRDVRYCEVLAAYLVGDAIRVDVWGTQGISDCPLDDWYALDSDTLQDELGAVRVVMNGPRHWVLDHVEAGSLPDVPHHWFGALEMQQLATLDLSLESLMSSGEPYQERTVNRDTLFAFFAGSEVYELVTPEGTTYVMQSYANIVDPELQARDLPGLGTRLTLPDGWIFRARTLDADLQLFADGTATILQDDLQNTYQRL